jgi:hypothetical protein
MLVKVLLWMLAILCVFGIAGRAQGMLAVEGYKMVQILVLCLIGLALTGCVNMRPDGAGTEWKHDSVLLRGAPFTDRTDVDGRKVEDSLDVWNNYLYWDRPGFYAEIGLGLKLREGGFYDDGSPFIVNARVGKRFKFGER